MPIFDFSTEISYARCGTITRNKWCCDKCWNDTSVINLSEIPKHIPEEQYDYYRYLEIKKDTMPISEYNIENPDKCLVCNKEKAIVWACEKCWDALPKHIIGDDIPNHIPKEQQPSYRAHRILKYLKERRVK